MNKLNYYKTMKLTEGKPIFLEDMVAEAQPCEESLGKLHIFFVCLLCLFALFVCLFVCLFVEESGEGSCFRRGK